MLGSFYPPKRSRRKLANASAAFGSSASIDASQTTYTFAGLSIGTPAANRVVIALLSFRGGTTARTLTSVTIGGVAATVHQNISAVSVSSGLMYYVMCSAVVPLGTTADVSATFSGTLLRGGVSTVIVQGASSALPTSSTQASGSGGSLNINVEPGNAVVGMTGSYSGGAGSVSWTGLSEIFDLTYGSPGADSSGALLNTTLSETPRAISFSTSATGVWGAAAVWS